MHFITQYQRFNISNMVCTFDNKIEFFQDNYLDLLFKHQDIRISIFNGLFIVSCSNFILEYTNSIDSSASFLSKYFFNEQ